MAVAFFAQAVSIESDGKLITKSQRSTDTAPERFSQSDAAAAIARMRQRKITINPLDQVAIDRLSRRWLIAAASTGIVGLVVTTISLFL